MKSNNKVKNIDKIDGPILVFGGVYSNLQALEEMQRIATQKEISSDRIICTGDVIGYCAQPKECVRLVKEWGIHVIAGNVELQLAEGNEECGCDFTEGSRCDMFSKQWYPYAQSQLEKEDIDFIKSLPEFIKFNFINRSYFVLHGSYFQTAEFIFSSTPWNNKAENFIATHADVILAGHSGIPFLEHNDEKTWCNAGVIGMPANDGNSQVWYVILEEGEQGETIYAHCAFEYDNQQAAALMLDRGLPASYAKTLSTGIWDNTEILPNHETAQTGQELQLVP